MVWTDADATFTALTATSELVSQDEALAALGEAPAHILSGTEASGTSEVGLYSYKNSASPTEAPVWLLTVDLDKAITSVSQGGYGFAEQAQTGDGCVYYFIVDATTGDFLTSGQHCDVIEDTQATPPPEGK